MINTPIAHYKITAKLGQGGMGEVYRATDTKLDREVAIKILPEEFAKHPERLARFEREAKALAKLNHPNIAAIYGFDQHEEQWFLVLELVEGEDLSQRLKRGPLDVDEALNVFQQIAEALEAAHEKGIVHRDLKPANIKIDPQGRVKVLDFGLAKARFSNSAESVDSNASTADSMAPTITSEFTMPGKVIGTAAYMSPEQSRGQQVDKRTDVWAFGCCLYEALTGKRPFKGATTSDLLADILKTDPDWTTLPPETPSEVMTLLRRCLEKEPRRRLRDIGDIAITLEETSSTSRTGIYSAPTTTEMATETLTASKLQSGRKLAQIVGAIVLALGFAYAVFDLVVGIDNAPSRDSAQSVDSIRSVAVLKIKPIGGDADLAVVANGLESDIRAQLSRIDGLERQPASRTVEKLAESEKLDSEIATELGVEGLVYGKITREGNEIELNVSLNHGPTDRTLWETNFTGSNPKALETQMVLSLLEQFDVPLTDEERDFLARADNVNIEAYTEYRRGVDALDVIGFANADIVIAHFKSAIDKDPGFLPPYLHQAWALWWPTIYGAESVTSEQAFTNAYAVLSDAENEFQDEPIINITRDFFGMVSDFKFVTAKRTLENALLESPNDPELLFMHLWYLVLIESRYPEAMRSVNTALAEDPNRIAFLDAKAEIYSFMDDERMALELNTGIAEENEEDFDRLTNNALSYKNLGELDRALQFATDAVRVSRHHPAATALLAEIHAAMGNAQEARRLLKEVEAKRDAGHGISYNWNARVEAQLGDTKAAARSLRAAYDKHEGWSFLYSMRNPHFTRLMSDEPAFWDLVGEMGYPPFPITHPLYDLEQEKRFGKGASSVSTSAAESKERIRKVAVLPFTSIASEENQVFAEGVSAILYSKLCKIPGLTVISDTSTHQFKDSSIPIPEIARKLMVDALIEGTVIRVDDQMMVTANLVNGVSGESQWGHSSLEQVSDLFSTMGKVASEIASNVSITITPANADAISGNGTASRKALDYYLRGIYEKGLSEKALKARLRFAQLAIEEDPNFALAHILKGQSHQEIAYYGFADREESINGAKSALSKARAVDPQLPEISVLAALVDGLDNYDLHADEQVYLEALRVAPNNSKAHEGYSIVAAILQRYQESIKHALRAQELDPLSVLAGQSVALAYFQSGDYKEALKASNEVIDQHEGSFAGYGCKALILVAMGRDAEAEENLRLAYERAERVPYYLSRLGYGLGVLGKKDEAAELLAQLEAIAETEPAQVQAHYFGLLYLGMGEDDTAIEWFDKALDNGETAIAFLGGIFRFDGDRRPLRDNPKYQPLLRRIGLPE